MRSFSRPIRIGQTVETCRLETPSMSGYRPGMSSSCVIGRKLGMMYDVPADMMNDIEGLLRALDRKLARAG